MEFNYQISQLNKVLPIDPVFSNWVNFNKNVHHKLFYKFKSLKADFFFFEFKKLKVFETTSFLFSFLVFITFFQLSVGYV